MVASSFSDLQLAKPLTAHNIGFHYKKHKLTFINTKLSRNKCSFCTIANNYSLCFLTRFLICYTAKKNKVFLTIIRGPHHPDIHSALHVALH